MSQWLFKPVAVQLLAAAPDYYFPGSVCMGLLDKESSDKVLLCTDGNEVKYHDINLPCDILARIFMTQMNLSVIS